jgi:osmotically-inducible protein OsmY
MAETTCMCRSRTATGRHSSTIAAHDGEGHQAQLDLYQGAAAASAYPVNAAAGAQEARMDDKTLKKLVDDELDWEPSIDGSGIGVTVENGIVHLTGHVANYAQKTIAETAVKRVKGVQGYVEDLEIRPFPRTYTDDALAVRVANLTDWDVAIPKGAVQVKVENGLVTLTGTVDWQYQRFAAEQGIRQLQGIRGVNNAIVVKPAVHAADIKHRIDEALERHAQVEADKIQVTVVGDRVRLEGQVRAWSEREIIEEAAWAAPGVQAVDDRVTVGA